MLKIFSCLLQHNQKTKYKKNVCVFHIIYYQKNKKGKRKDIYITYNLKVCSIAPYIIMAMQIAHPKLLPLVYFFIFFI